MGDLSEPPVEVGNGAAGSMSAKSKEIQDAMLKAAALDACRLSINVHLSKTVSFTWESILIGNKLFVEVPKFILPDGSKESFVRLLEYGEDELCCTHVIVCFKKDRPDRASLIRVFTYMGFKLLPPGHPFVPAASGDIMYLAYAIDIDAGGGDSD